MAVGHREAARSVLDGSEHRGMVEWRGRKRTKGHRPSGRFRFSSLFTGMRFQLPVHTYRYNYRVVRGSARDFAESFEGKCPWL